MNISSNQQRQFGFTLLEIMLSLSLLSMVTVWQFSDKVFADKQKFHERTANRILSVAETVNLFWQQAVHSNQTDLQWPAHASELKRLTVGESLLRNDDTISIQAYQFNQSIDTVENSTHVVISRTSASLAAAQAISLHISLTQKIIQNEAGYINQVIVIPKTAMHNNATNTDDNNDTDIYLLLQDYFKLDGSRPLRGNVNANASSITNVNLMAADLVTAKDGILILSDERLKHNIKPLPILPDNLFDITPIIYSTARSNRKRIGFSAQEIEKIYPSLVVETINGTKQVDYIQFLPILLGHLQYLSARLELLENRTNNQ